MVIPYLVFNGKCKEVLKFYQEVFESKSETLILYDKYVPIGVMTPPSDLNTWVLHAEMKICGTTFWFADEIEVSLKGNITRLTATVPTLEDAQNIFDKLKVNGEISLPPTKTFYSTFHAALTDKFGVSWNIVADEAPNTK